MSIRAVAMAFGALLMAAPAAGHQSSMAYSTLELDDERRVIRYSLRLSADDLFEALRLNEDRPATTSEIDQGQTALLDYVLPRITVSTAPRMLCTVKRGGARPVKTETGRFAEVHWSYRCPEPVDRVTVDYDLFFDLDPRHSAPVTATWAGQRSSVILSDDENRFDWYLGEPPPSGFTGFLESGVEHILFGFDHILFLVSLLLMAVLARREGVAPEGGEEHDGGTAQVPGSEVGDPAEGASSRGGRPPTNDEARFDLRSPRDGARYALAIVTSFTVAHSITLIAAALGYIPIPAQVVESIIALSIVYVAIENIVRPDPPRRYLITFAFGLLHGMGFAAMLRELLPSEGLVVPVLAFNLGVEVGQLLIVAVLLPLLFTLARALGPQSYRRRVLPIGGGALAILGALWLIERIFTLSLLPF